MSIPRNAAIAALAFAASPAFASTLPPTALLESNGILSFSSAGGFQAEGALTAEYRQPPLGARPYIFSTSLSFGTLDIKPDLTLTTPEIVIREATPETEVCLPFFGCNTFPAISAIVLDSQTINISPDIPLTGLGTVFEGSVRSPGLVDVGAAFDFDYGTPLFGAPLTFGEVVQDQFETGDATVSVTGGVGPFDSLFDYNGELQPGGEQILAEYALTITGPGILGDIESFALGLINDNTDLLVGFAFDLFLDTNPCAQFGGLAGICNGLLAGLEPNEVGLTVNSLGTLSADYTLAKSIVPVPLPAALPLMAGGLGMLGLMGWRRRRSIAA